MNGTVRVSAAPVRDLRALTAVIRKSDIAAIDRALAGKVAKDPDVRTFYDPDADRNLSNAIIGPRPVPSRGLTGRMVAAGWSLVLDDLAAAA